MRKSSKGPDQESNVPSLRVALCPLNSSDDLSKNIESCLRSLEKVESRPCDLVLFPENSLYFHLGQGALKASALSEKTHSPYFEPFLRWSRDHQCQLLFGGVPWLVDGKVYNSILRIDPVKGLQEVYRKIHLFDVDLPNVRLSESSQYSAGESPRMGQLGPWSLGFSICYDMRFSELFLSYRQQGVAVLMAPAAFTVETGRAHWKTLLQARAIEMQCYMLAPAQWGEHRSQSAGGASRATWGQSLAIDPWGEILAQSPSFDEGRAEALEPLFVELSRQRLDQVRQSMPVMEHRRLNN